MKAEEEIKRHIHREWENWKEKGLRQLRSKYDPELVNQVTQQQ